MAEKVLKLFNSAIKAVDAENKTIECVISTDQIDRDGDIILPSAIEKGLETYRRHPVLLNSHSYHNVLDQIGVAEDVKVEAGKVCAKFKYYAGEGNENADWAWKLAQKGVAAFSIGFMTNEFEFIKDAQGIAVGRKFTSIELLEVSQVLIPSNRGALQFGRSVADEQTKMMELVSKSFNDEDFKLNEVKEAEQEHYTANILEKRVEEPKPSIEIGVEEMKEAIKQSISSIIGSN